MYKVVLALILIISGVHGIPTSTEHPKPEEKVVGGYPAPDGQFPYQISLRTRSNIHFCGGSIISPSWILTAAHCVNGQDTSSMFVAVGTNYLNQGGTGYLIVYIIMHPNYDSNDKENDIALIQIAGTIAFNARVQSVPLATSYIEPGVTCILSGWGLTTYPSEETPNLLQYIALSTITNTQCRAQLPGFLVSETNLCTYEQYGRGACKGDSGGPLYCNGALHGVVSWGIPCAKQRPDVFTSVAAYRVWINAVSGI